MLDASMRALAASLTLSVRDPAITIGVQAAVEVYVEGERYFAGFVDRVDASFDNNSSRRTIHCRSLAGDLADCAAAYAPGEWRGKNLGDLARLLAAPFEIPVHVTDAGESFPIVTIAPGDLIADVLARYARIAGRVILPTSDGGIEVTSASRTPSGRYARQGVNVLAADGSVDVSQRFSRYEVLGQANADPWSEDVVAETEIYGSATDAGVRRYRPWAVASNAADQPAFAEKRAEWESRIRVAEAVTCSVTLHGWVQDGRLWRPNELIKVELPALGINGLMLVESVTLILGRFGRETVLQLTTPDAFNAEPVSVQVAESSPWEEETEYVD